MPSYGISVYPDLSPLGEIKDCMAWPPLFLPILKAMGVANVSFEGPAVRPKKLKLRLVPGVTDAERRVLFEYYSPYRCG